MQINRILSRMIRTRKCRLFSQQMGVSAPPFFTKRSPFVHRQWASQFTGFRTEMPFLKQPSLQGYIICVLKAAINQNLPSSL
uniref:Uncharacterized protein n=1 Tax=Arundo donax TaxID=35708 RepID=A0A0A8YF65_ARUDO